MSRFSAISAVRRVPFRRDEHLPLLRDLRLGLHDVDRRHRADFDLHLVVPKQLFGELSD